MRELMPSGTQAAPGGGRPSIDVLIVDDDESNRYLHDRTLAASGYTCSEAADVATAKAKLAAGSYRAVLLDLHLGADSGLDLLTYIRTANPDVAVIMVTGVDDPVLAQRAIEIGAFGYMVKPIRITELVINVANALYRRDLEAVQRRSMARLESAVQARTEELMAALNDLEHSQDETILRLAKVVEFRDEETGRHVERMSRYCGLLARQLGLGQSEMTDLQLASRLHDVGKISVPDSILFKPGKLTTEEMEVMKGHASAGFRMLANSESRVIQLGAEIAHTHHERWDGAGYPRKLAGDKIPLMGRIAAVADVFDALTSRRPYRAAIPVGTAVEMMTAQRGLHFDPVVLDVMLSSMSQVENVRQRYVD